MKYDDGDFEEGVYDEFIRKLPGSSVNSASSGSASPIKSTLMSL